MGVRNAGQRAVILKLSKFVSQRNDYWENNLNDEDRYFFASIDYQREHKEEDDFPQHIFEYIKLERTVWEIGDKLRLIEKQKLSNAIEKLISDFKKIKNDLPIR